MAVSIGNESDSGLLGIINDSSKGEKVRKKLFNLWSRFLGRDSIETNYTHIEEVVSSVARDSTVEILTYGIALPNNRTLNFETLNLNAKPFDMDTMYRVYVSKNY